MFFSRQLLAAESRADKFIKKFAAKRVVAYVYLAGSAVVAFFWFLFYAARPDLRRKMLLTSGLGGVLGFSETLFIPDYWRPQFQVIRISDELFVESLLFAFFLAGFSSVLYQVVFRKPLFEADRVDPKLLLAPPIVFALYPLAPGVNIIFFTLAGMLIGASAFYLSDKSLGKPILLNGLLTFAFFLPNYILFWKLFPSLVASYNYSALSGVKLFKIPLEELLFYFSVGSSFCLIYEVLMSARIKQVLKLL